MGFAKDLLDGMEKEEHVMEFYRTFTPVSRAEKKALGFDFLASAAVEVKYDRQALDTGNIAVEYEYNGKASGITSTQATNWVFVTDEGAWMVPTPQLRVDIMLNDWKTTKGGDGWKSKLHLMPYEHVKNNYTELYLYE